ncbi:biopolymer transporter ExbD [Phaeobacter sp. B1627]|uniref:biopolymer transporter ExbD n=1 Tax=Phaeobacter sp. B1627 TaxID=2583809 RepID=UPI00111BCD49|nr:biopolymer transporter ExbD [Phaeobacter sp. B1627]TNJ44440.1 biopolymer transporter ExbD [Phaeobacter sp. B1627]
MALRMGKRSARRLSMTSLIDVIFLLLLFFMLSSTFSRYGAIDLMAAEGGQGVAADSRPLFLKLDTAQISLNGETLALADLDLRLKSMTGAAASPEQQTQQVLLSLSPEVTSQRLVDVLAILNRQPTLTVTVLG